MLHNHLVSSFSALPHGGLDIAGGDFGYYLLICHSPTPLALIFVLPAAPAPL